MRIAPHPRPRSDRVLREHVFVHRPLVKKTGRPAGHARTRPVEMRVCRHHGTTEFAHYGAQPHTRRWQCKRCVAEAVTRRHQQLKRILVEAAGGCCVICGYNSSIVALQFHHVDSATKEFPMSTASGKSIAAYLREARKCVLVCANCHCELEMGLVPCPPAGTRFEEWLHHTGPDAFRGCWEEENGVWARSGMPGADSDEPEQRVIPGIDGGD